MTDKGFEVMLKQRECPMTTVAPSSCDQVFDSMHFILVSPNYPREYDNGLECRYVIRRSDEDVCRLEMKFLKFDVESSSDCEYDYLAINGEKICGLIENATRTYLFQDYEKQLVFHTDSGTSRPGFMIEVEQVDCAAPTTEPPSLPSKPCNKQFSASQFEIRSENYPDNYDSHLRCRYRIIRTGPNICGLEATFLNFDVESSDGCQYDYLLLGEEKLCGLYPTNLKRVVPFEGSDLTLEFRSDGATSRPGFHIRFRQVECADRVPESKPATCGDVYTNSSGTFHSPGFPESYPGFQKCVFRFMALPGNCRIAFHFLEFGLHTTDSLCEKDYLRINGINYCGLQLLGQKRTVTFYGSPRIVEVNFQSDPAMSDKGFYAVYRQLPCSPALGRSPAKRRPGKARRSCDRLYASLTFNILSPGQPNSYPTDAECRYTIRRLSPRICRLKLIFRTFDVESSDGCEYDYLEVEGEKLCGVLPPDHIRMVELKDYQIIFKFHSDSANTRPGFIVKVEQIECKDQQAPSLPPPRKNVPPLPVVPPQVPIVAEPLDDHVAFPPPHLPPLSYEQFFDYPMFEESSLQKTLQKKLVFQEPQQQNCDRTFQTSEFEIRSFNFPLPYPNGINCRYLVRKSSDDICWVKLLFLRFDLEESDDCQFDYLSINNRRICGTLPDDEIRAYMFNSEEISMYFRSDGANAHRGFLIRGQQLKCKNSQVVPPLRTPPVCDRKYDREIFVVQSPQFPDTYPNDVECTFVVQKANKYICGLQMTLLSFDVENDPECAKDYLDLEGERICGPIPARTIRKFPFIGESFNILFKSDSKTTRPGFSMLVNQLEDCDSDLKRAESSKGRCAFESSAEAFVLASPGFPEEYPPNAECEYRIRKHSPEHCRIELRILAFDLEEGTSSPCDVDRLHLPDGRNLCGKLPKDYTENVLFSNKEELMLAFVSDKSNQKSGFSIQVRQHTDCEPETKEGGLPDCGGTFEDSEFSIKSPNFPNEYPHNIVCEYKIFKSDPRTCGLELKFAHFDVEKGPECGYDSLDIGHKTICGHLPSGFTRTISFESSLLSLVFRSDKGTSRSGFAIKIRQIAECATTWKPATPPPRMCDYCLKEPRGHVISPDYPDDYANRLKCSYRLQRTPGFCAVDVFFHDFHLQQTPGCSGDAIIINEKKYCGDQLKGRVKKIDFPISDANELLIRFETDDNGTASGFHAEYRQIPCRGHSWRQSEEWKPTNVSSLWNAARS